MKNYFDFTENTWRKEHLASLPAVAGFLTILSKDPVEWIFFLRAKNQ